MPRSLDEILVDAVDKIKPPVDSVEAFCAQLTAGINAARRAHQEIAKTSPPGEMKECAKAYLALLKKTKKAALQQRQWTLPGASDDFITALDREINQVDACAWGLVVPPGSPQRNVVADIVAIMARDLIDPNPYRHPENYERLQVADKDIGGGRVHRAFTMKGELVRPGRKFSPDEVLAISIANRRTLIKDGYLEVFPPAETCPWRRCATLTDGGVWPMLAALIYEGATGEVASDSMMMKHCREADEQQPRYLVKGLRFQA